jgi:hypothetical protein
LGVVLTSPPEVLGGPQGKGGLDKDPSQVSLKLEAGGQEEFSERPKRVG